MNQSSYNGYLRIIQVNAPRPQGTMSRSGLPHYSISATGRGITGSYYNENLSKYEDEVREVDLIFAGLTERQARMFAVNCEVLVNNASAYVYDAKVGYSPEMIELAKLDPNYVPTENGVITPQQIAAGLAAVIPEHRSLIEKLYPATRRKMQIVAKAGDWRIVAHPNQIESAQQHPEIDMGMQ